MPLVQTRGAASAQGFGEFAQSGIVVKVNGSPVSTDTYIYNNSNTVNTIQVVGGDKEITFSLWGAAGGNGGYGTQPGSGAGGFTKGTITLQNNITYYLYVGQGGRKPSASNFGTGGSGGFPNGGYGTSGDATGAGGGGMTMLSAVTFSVGMSDGNIYLISGGGGGSTGYNGQAGAGGGSSGQNGTGSITGGTQAAGGTHNGAKLQGGNATGTQGIGGTDDGGGGGGGFYGGGGGTSDAFPGAGGSGYFNTSVVTSGSTTQGTGITTPNPDSDPTITAGGYANGQNDQLGVLVDGRDGLAKITFS